MPRTIIAWTIALAACAGALTAGEAGKTVPPVEKKASPAAGKAAPAPILKLPAPPSKEGLAKQLADLVGGRRVKVIWNRGGRDEGCLMGFDTEEGKERVIVPAPIVCSFAYFSSDGERILFSSAASEASISALKQRGSSEEQRALFSKAAAEQTAYVVDWDGKNLRKFLTGRHYTVHGTWRDPATGIEWVYVSDCESKEASAEIVASGKPGWAEKFGTYYGLSVYRYRLDNPSVREVVWDKYPIGARSPVSADGTMLAVEMDWPACGVIPVPNGTYKIIGNGCNSHIAPDGSGLFFNLIGDHRTITIYDKAGALKASILINGMPGIKDPERKVWRPRWSNDVRVFSVQSADTGPDGDVFVGEFNESFTGVKRWVQVTDTADNDGCPLVWVKPVMGPVSKGVGAGAGGPAAGGGMSAADGWIGSREGLIFLWRNAHRVKFPALALGTNGEPMAAFSLTARSNALYGANYEMRLKGGAFLASGVGESLSAAVTMSGLVTFEAYVKPPAVSSTDAVGRIVSYAGAGGTMFALGQKGHSLMIGRRTANTAADKTGWAPLMTLPDAKPFHLVVSCDTNQITVYRDGQEAGRVQARLVAGVWQPGQLVFGANGDGRESWGGRLEGVAFYNRALPAAEVAANAKGYAAIVALRKPVEQLRVKAALVARSVSRTTIDPYLRAMAVSEYKVSKVISGTYQGQKLYVSTWTVMHRKLLPSATRPLQQEYELLVEPFTSHPELEPELQFDTLGRDFEIPLYYEVED